MRNKLYEFPKRSHPYFGIEKKIMLLELPEMLRLLSGRHTRVTTSCFDLRLVQVDPFLRALAPLTHLWEGMEVRIDLDDSWSATALEKLLFGTLKSVHDVTVRADRTIPRPLLARLSSAHFPRVNIHEGKIAGDVEAVTKFLLNPNGLGVYSNRSGMSERKGRLLLENFREVSEF